MSRLIVFITFIFICVSDISSLSYVTEATIENIGTAIKSNIVDKYGSRGTLNATELKEFISNVLKSNHSKIYHENDTWDSMELQQACNSTKHLTSCKKVISEKCLDRSVLSELYAAPHVNGSWTDVFPALVYQLQSTACLERQEDGTEHTTSHSKTPTGMAWAYGLGFSVLNCFISMSGGCMIPFMKFKVFKRIMMYCVGLGVSILVSVGCLVLLPESLELTGTDSPVPDYHFNMATVLGGVYLFYLSHRLKKIWTNARKATPKKEADIAIHVIATSDGLQIIPSEVNPEQDQGFCELPDEQPDGTASNDSSDNKHQNKAKTGEVATVAWMLLIGDAIHKFIDGVSVGASFTENVFTGVSVAVAILCEELPHELGDIALLLHAGMDIKRALMYNLLAVIPSFFGVTVGIVLGENTDATTWILSIAGGMFIYISLVDMLPELDEQAKELIEKDIETPSMALLIQNLGLLTGFCIIFLLAEFGDDMVI